MDLQHIIIVLDDDKNCENKVNIAVQLAGILDIDIELKWLIEGPKDWDFLNRTEKNKYPTVKAELQHARNIMDELLKNIRQKDVKASKQFIFSMNSNTNLEFDRSNVILLDTAQLEKLKCVKPICNYFIIPAERGNLKIETVVYTSDYTNSNLSPEHLLTSFTLKGNIRLELVYINTPVSFENSAISIDKIKGIISNLGLAKTHISIFQASSKVEGILSFADLKDGDLAIINQPIDIETVKNQDLSLPLLLLNQHG